MVSMHFLAKLLATVILVLLLVSDTTPAASKLISDGREKMLPVPSVGIGGRVGWRKMNAGRVMIESVRGKGLSIRRSLRPFPSPPPSPVKSPSPHPIRPPRHPPPPRRRPPPSKQ